MRIYYLQFQSGLKTPLRSDTLWGSICWAVRMLYGNERLEKLIASYAIGQPEFLISSGFPYKKVGNQKLPFFPRPLLPAQPHAESPGSVEEKVKATNERKKLKKLTMLNQSLFEQVLSGKLTTEALLHQFRADKLPTEWIAPRLQQVSVTRNTIDRIKGATLKKDESGQLFHVEEMYLSDANQENSDPHSVGFYFLAKGDTEVLEAALRYLGHIGIGGDRTTGKGAFTFEKEAFVLKEPQQYNAMINLSLYYPDQVSEELTTYKGKAAFTYQLEERQGRLGFLPYPTDARKQSVLMFKEGSTFPITPSGWKVQFGSNPIVKKRDSTVGLDHLVYQYGIGFMVKLYIPS